MEEYMRQLADWEHYFQKKYHHEPTTDDIAKRPRVAATYQRLRELQARGTTASCRTGDSVNTTRERPLLRPLSASRPTLDQAGFATEIQHKQQPSASAQIPSKQSSNATVQYVRSPFGSKIDRLAYERLYTGGKEYSSPSAKSVLSTLESKTDSLAVRNHPIPDIVLPPEPFKTPTKPRSASKADSIFKSPLGSIHRNHGVSPSILSSKSKHKGTGAMFVKSDLEDEWIGPSPAKSGRSGRTRLMESLFAASVEASDEPSSKKTNINSISNGQSNVFLDRLNSIDLPSSDGFLKKNETLPLNIPNPVSSKNSDRAEAVLTKMPEFFKLYSHIHCHPHAEPTNVAPDEGVTPKLTSQADLPGNLPFGDFLNKDSRQTTRPEQGLTETHNAAMPVDHASDEHSMLPDEVENEHPENDKYKIRKLFSVGASAPRWQTHGDQQKTSSQRRSRVSDTPKRWPHHSRHFSGAPDDSDDSESDMSDINDEFGSARVVVCPNKFVNSRTLKREASNHLLLSSNYHEFLSLKEQQAFSDVIKYVDQTSGNASTTIPTDEISEPPCFGQTTVACRVAGSDDSNHAVSENVQHSNAKPIAPSLCINSRARTAKPRSKSERVSSSPTPMPDTGAIQTPDEERTDEVHTAHEDTIRVSGRRRRPITVDLALKRESNESESSISDAPAGKHRKMKDTADMKSTTKASQGKTAVVEAALDSKPKRDSRIKKETSTTGTGVVNSNYRALKLRKKPLSGRSGATGGRFGKGFGSKRVTAYPDTTRLKNAYGELEEVERKSKIADAIVEVELVDIPIDFVHTQESASPSCIPVYHSKKSSVVYVDLHLALKRLCGLDSFRAGQEEAITRIMSGNSTLIILPTGGGKSLCYQLPAFIFRHIQQVQPSIILVISPTISLMRDQMRCLPAGLRAACLSSGHQSVSVTCQIYAKLESNELDILFVSPERLQSASFNELIQLGKIPPIRIACIDEAHCLSEWSHNFRPSYLHLHHILKKRLHVECFVALSATATVPTQHSICTMLNIDPIAGSIVSPSIIRDNLVVSVTRVSADDSRDATLAQTDRVAQYLRVRDFDADSYHSGKTPEQREYVQTRFLHGRLRIIVATVAFGLGINKHNVRSVIHYSMPKSIEDYMQEIGRSGRNGEPSYCNLFLLQEDYVKHRSFAFSDGVDEAGIWRLLNLLFVPNAPSKSGSSSGSLRRTKTYSEKADPASMGRLVLPIQKLELELDTRESVISTLLSYIELSDSDCPPIKVYPALSATFTLFCSKSKLEALSETSQMVRWARVLGTAAKYGLEFDTFKVAKAANMEPQDISSELWKLQMGKQLKFNSGDKAFNIMINIAWENGDERQEYLDKLCDALFKKMIAIEATSVWKLDYLYETLHSSTHDSLDVDMDPVQELDHSHEANIDNDLPLRTPPLLQTPLMDSVVAYFRLPEMKRDQLEGSKWGFRDPEIIEKQKLSKMNVEISIKAFVKAHLGEVTSGRAVARIFHGLSSPKYPAKSWSSNKHWNSYPFYNFKDLARLASKAMQSRQRI
ncbi:hypothetical protein BASA62_003924 [Batrachochytrium salamandrivorans]|nr:hypothetical protein BASA62_003924 [Batrachochytrium salamandrivorans]